MKSSRFKHDYRKNASKLHKLVGDLLRDSLFKDYKIYQEYPVNKINELYPSGREKFDWYVKDLNLVIEVHGEQHYMPVTFGGITEQEAELNFRRQQFRDVTKRNAALDAGATYLIIKYDEELNEDILARKIIDAKQELEFEMDYELKSEELEQHEEELKTRKDKRRERMELKKLASERRKEIRKLYKGSERHKNQLEKAKKFRKQNYQKQKQVAQSRRQASHA